MSSIIGAHPTACKTQCKPTCCNVEKSKSQLFAAQPRLLEKERGWGEGTWVNTSLVLTCTKIVAWREIENRNIRKAERRQGLSFFLSFVPNKCSSSPTLNHVPEEETVQRGSSCCRAGTEGNHPRPLMGVALCCTDGGLLPPSKHSRLDHGQEMIKESTDLTQRASCIKEALV